MSKTKTARISSKAYAQRRGVTRQAVMRAIKDGRLTPKSVRKDRRGLYRIDPELADIEWQQNTAVENDRTQRNGDGDGPEVYLKARTVRTATEARLKQLQLERLEGRLVDADEVERTMFAIFRRLRDALNRIPDRCAEESRAEISDVLRRALKKSKAKFNDKMVPEAHEMRTMIQKCVDEALEELSSGALRG